MDAFKWKNICQAGKQALKCFVISAAVLSVSFFSGSLLGSKAELWCLTYWGPGFYLCLSNYLLRYCYSGMTLEISIRAAFLGSGFATGAFLSTFDNGWRVFGLYIMILTFFHFSEFMGVALTNPKTLSLDSFILNHSIQYGVAAVSSWVEWAAEYYFFPDLKMHFWISYLGVVMCVGGEILRKSAMITAMSNFTHTVQFVKNPDHVLVTHGVYSLCRHPSYVGWLYWSIGTQIILLNPFCLVVYTLASWSFFRSRVYAEEATLLAFFGAKYQEYQKKVPTGLPFIHGYTGGEVREDFWGH